MAIKEIKREWSPCQLGYVKHFLLHDEEDVKNLPRCSVGSTATVSATDNEYVKTVSGWKLKSECDEDGGTGGGGGGPSVQPDWNQTDETKPDFIRNKPFGEMPTGGDTLKWEGIAEDVIDESLLVGGVFYPISDAVITIDDCAQGARLVSKAMDVDIEIPADAFEDNGQGAVYSGGFAFIAEDNVSAETDGEVFTFPKAGVYVPNTIATADIYLTFYGCTKFPSTKKIDAKYMPENVVLTSPGGKKFILTVDDSGTLVATETVD